jgi:hypothetical protein
VMAAPLVLVLTIELPACALLWFVGTPTGNETVVDDIRALSLCFYWLLATSFSWLSTAELGRPYKAISSLLGLVVDALTVGFRVIDLR